jgi:arylsulfatase
VQKLATPHVINLKMDPKEGIPVGARQGWVSQHMMKIIADFQKSVKQEPLIPAGAPLEFVPRDN